jgi:hypothetical protein
VTKGTLSDIRVLPTAALAFFQGEWRDGSGRHAGCRKGRLGVRPPATGGSCPGQSRPRDLIMGRPRACRVRGIGLADVLAEGGDRHE